jgi:hypothetical protein
MVARMRTGQNILGALNYNENKVKAGSAECIAANMFGCESGDLSFYNKKNRFQDQMRLNKRSKTNVVHISLNFAVGEKLSNEKLQGIASAYMDRIGFTNQPYLVYNHFDAGHPHIHILTTSIQDNGKRIPLHNIGKNQSEKARKEIESIFNLVKAEDREVNKECTLDPKNLATAVYGKSQTKEAISKIVRTITRSYKFTSIPELNAVLQQYNVVADRGREGTIMNQKKGLVYSLLDEHGNKVGVPIKASSIYGKPTLVNLEKQFKLNEALRKPYRERLQASIQSVFSKSPTLKVVDFVKALEKANIKIVFRQNEEGRVYGITFIDHQNRVVFNGSDLGKEYSAKAIMERLTEIPKNTSLNKIISKPATGDSEGSQRTPFTLTSTGIEQAIKDLTSPENANQGVEPLLTRRRRKKRKGKSI